ncbi:MAG: hypothetical protein V4438_04110 [Patescibacteria group bacterium]
MNWGSKMKSLYISGVVILLLLLIGVPVYFKYFDKAPSCFDNKQNQDEIGVDCGGDICTKLCAFQARDPIISFERLYEASSGNYTAIALVENPNQGVFSRNISYVFKIYDKDNVLLFEIPGTTFAPPGRTFPIFASQILTGNRIASKVTFAIAGGAAIEWQKSAWTEPNVKVTNIKTSVVNGRSRIEADITNSEVYTIKNLQVAAVVYDKNGNAAEASATTVASISPLRSTHIVFAWNSEFAFDVGKIDIIPRPVPRDWETAN